MHRVSKLKLADINPFLICKLCNGYFIDPCTAQECLHSFCKTCIVNHLTYTNCTCPICGIVLHKTRPLEMIRHDQTLQDLVYKLIPGVFKREMERRREFYAQHPDPDPNACGNSEERGEVKDDGEILAEDDNISLALVHSPIGDVKAATEESASLPTIYLKCPANFPISGLKKLLRSKYSLSGQFLIDVFHSDESLNDESTLMDIAYIYTWRRRGPLRLFYTIYQFDEKSFHQQKQASSNPESPESNVKDFHVSDEITVTELHDTPASASGKHSVSEPMETSSNDSKAKADTSACDSMQRRKPAALANQNTKQPSAANHGDDQSTAGTSATVSADTKNTDTTGVESTTPGEL